MIDDKDNLTKVVDLILTREIERIDREMVPLRHEKDRLEKMAKRYRGLAEFFLWISVAGIIVSMIYLFVLLIRGLPI